MQATHETNKHECPLKWLMNWVQGAILLTEYSQARSEVRVRINNCDSIKLWDEITPPSLNFDGGLAKPPMKLDKDIRQRIR